MVNKARKHKLYRYVKQAISTVNFNSDPPTNNVSFKSEGHLPRRGHTPGHYLNMLAHLRSLCKNMTFKLRDTLFVYVLQLKLVLIFTLLQLW